ncbi:MAG: EAL domain-containing protein [Burkholderiales bacterium]|nr:EAL domain-containing protein [Burkholderiales bacterium]
MTEFGPGLYPPQPLVERDRVRILLVDDEERIRDAVMELIARPGREILTCGNGNDALRVLATQHVDLALLDIRLPDMTGLDIMERMRGSGLSVRVIVVSADDQVDSAISALRYGAYEYVRKPFEPAALRRTVDNALEQLRLQRENVGIRSRLEQSERLHRYLIDQSPDLIYTLDQGGRFTFVNERFNRLLGFTREELIGHHYSAIVHRDDVKRAEFAFNERRTGQRASSNVEMRVRRRGGDGTPCTIVLSAVGLYAPERRQTEEADDAEKPSEQRTGFIGTYGVGRDISDRKRAEELVSYHAYYDVLTGLPNRTLFRDRLRQAIAQARRHRTRLAVMFIDLDRFKLINDTYGHVRGDLFLQQVAGRLRRQLRNSDTLCRLGGDEFTVLVPDLRSPDDAAQKAQQFLDALRRPFVVENDELSATASIGLSVFPDHGANEDELIRNADLAMYQVKRRGKDNVGVFEKEMSSLYSEKINLEGELRRALQRQELQVHYQPIHEVSKGVVECVEALVRWNHPKLGQLDPARFVYIAEETGLISALSDRVLDCACAQLGRWREDGFAGVHVAVNVSPRDFERTDFTERVAQALARHRVPADGLELEITENVLIEDVDAAIDKIRQLRKQGVRISIDDFGTRYSSLGYLQRLPVNTIKIDQVFTRELDEGDTHSPIVHAIIGIARGLGLHLVAEGVERPVHRDALRRLGCHSMQGFLFSPALAPEEATGYLRRMRAAPLA